MQTFDDIMGIGSANTHAVVICCLQAKDSPDPLGLVFLYASVMIWIHV